MFLLTTEQSDENSPPKLMPLEKVLQSLDSPEARQSPSKDEETQQPCRPADTPKKKKLNKPPRHTIKRL